MDHLDVPYAGEDQLLPWSHLRASEFLEHAGVRHCIVGDTVARRLGSPIMIGNVFIAVDDEQLAEGCSVLLGRGLKPAKPQRELCYAGASTHAFCGHCETEEDDPFFEGLAILRTLLVPASSWHLDLSPGSIATNTFLLDNTLCRFPNTLFYVDALIAGIAEKFDVPGVDGDIAGYLHLQYVYVAELLSQDEILSLPPEDQLFMELFGKVILRSVMRKVCKQWQLIRDGRTSVDAARRRIPRPDLGIAAIKKKYHPQGSGSVDKKMSFKEKHGIRFVVDEEPISRVIRERKP